MAKTETAELKPGQPYSEDRFGYRHPIVGQTADGPVEIPAGEPSDKWSNPQLDAYAQRTGIDFAGVKNKSDRLAAIGAHTPAGDPALPPQ